jgi:hypothetical protein
LVTKRMKKWCLILALAWQRPGSLHHSWSMCDPPKQRVLRLVMTPAQRAGLNARVLYAIHRNEAHTGVWTSCCNFCCWLHATKGVGYVTEHAEKKGTERKCQPFGKQTQGKKTTKPRKETDPPSPIRAPHTDRQPANSPSRGRATGKAALRSFSFYLATFQRLTSQCMWPLCVAGRVFFFFFFLHNNYYFECCLLWLCFFLLLTRSLLALKWIEFLVSDVCSLPYEFE